MRAGVCRKGNILPGRTYRGASGQLEDMALKLCDALIGDFTGRIGDPLSAGCNNLISKESFVVNG